MFAQRGSRLGRSSSSRRSFHTAPKQCFSQLRHRIRSFTPSSTSHSSLLSSRFLGSVSSRRGFSSEPEAYMKKLRNIGISAHIDSGKTTLTERILFYTGKIDAIHEVRGKDGVGAKMDSMELEREKGITIKSAATHTNWLDHHFNIIDTPGHIDFTVEVERSLRVLDGAILVLCGVSGVQTQTLTVDRQMKRYSVPRIAFINKLDREGANPDRVIANVRKQLGLSAAAIQIPIGLSKDLQGVVDVMRMKAIYFDGEDGDTLREEDVPVDLKEAAEAKRAELIETVSEVDPELEEMFLNEEEPTLEQLQAGIRRATLALKFVPVYLGSAFKNKGVQPLLDGVVHYLPNPAEVKNYALDLDNEEKEMELKPSSREPLVSLAFKLEESKFGQLTWMRIYQGTLKKGDNILDTAHNKKLKAPRLVRMHSSELQDVQTAPAGEIVAMFGVDCASGTSFTDGKLKYSLTSMHVPETVISYAIKPPAFDKLTAFQKALRRFTREDPTFQLKTDEDTGETVISGMGELHLNIYLERLKREYGVDCQVSPPRVAYHERITQRADFDFLLKRQTGGSGVYARIMGYIEPMGEDSGDADGFEFKANLRGDHILPEYLAGAKKGFEATMKKGPLTGAPLFGVRFVFVDGVAHEVDSSSFAFEECARMCIRQAMPKAGGVILEPVMKVESQAPAQFEKGLNTILTNRGAMITDSTYLDQLAVIRGRAPLESMFGFATEIRQVSEGKGEFSMEYDGHEPALPQKQKMLEDKYKKSIEEGFEEKRKKK